MSLSEDKFATNLTNPTPPVIPVPEEEPKENIRGIITAGWVLAVLLPFVGIILNLWLVKNSNKYSYKKAGVVVALILSVICSIVLLLLLFVNIYGFATYTPTQ